jgi:hypothetical protein
MKIKIAMHAQGAFMHLHNQITVLRTYGPHIAMALGLDLDWCDILLLLPGSIPEWIRSAAVVLFPPGSLRTLAAPVIYHPNASADRELSVSCFPIPDISPELNTVAKIRAFFLPLYILFQELTSRMSGPSAFGLRCKLKATFDHVDGYALYQPVTVLSKIMFVDTTDNMMNILMPLLGCTTVYDPTMIDAICKVPYAAAAAMSHRWYSSWCHKIFLLSSALTVLFNIADALGPDMHDHVFDCVVKGIPHLIQHLKKKRSGGLLHILTAVQHFQIIAYHFAINIDRDGIFRIFLTEGLFQYMDMIVDQPERHLDRVSVADAIRLFDCYFEQRLFLGDPTTASIQDKLHRYMTPSE